MRIAQIAPIVERVPPKRYGGTERVVSALTEELVKRGHDVTLFASGDSQTSATLMSVYPRALREARLKDLYGLNYLTLLNFGMAYHLQDTFDIIHDHVMPLSLPTANLATTPVIGTMHGPFTGENRKLFQTLRTPAIVSISNAQAFPAPNIQYLGTVYNGLPLANFPFGDVGEDYLLFVGRISIEKGVHLAIEVAQQLDMRLIIAAKLETVDVPYFKEYVEPWLSERIQWVGEVDETERNALMCKALCFLHPVTWREPFGLTLIEAMACGCPVVAMNRGSIPEIIQNGITGYVVEDVEGMISAVEGIGNISREICREHVLTNFSVEKMTDGYEEMYERVLAETPKKRVVTAPE
jgi:glycosyltransferase involved in cell wall biosynthesis